jgi:DNA-binding PucR family transcriptional regulator
MIAETLAGISLFKAAVDGIKGAIGTANDVGEIAGFIDKLFEGESQVQQERNKKSGVGLGEQFGVKSVASEIINAKLAKEQMYEIAQMVDLRFGAGTWRGIVDERARRLREAKEAEAEKRKAELAKRRQFEDNMKQGAAGLAVLGVMVLAIIGMLYFATRG